MNKKFSFNARLKSFSYAIQGIGSFFQSEHNAWLHLLGTLTVIILAFVYPVSRMELIALSFAVSLVWIAELFNSAIEKMMDIVSEEKNLSIKLIKDMSAAAVLIAAVTAFIVGCIIFLPKL